MVLSNRPIGAVFVAISAAAFGSMAIFVLTVVCAAAAVVTGGIVLARFVAEHPSATPV